MTIKIIFAILSIVLSFGLYVPYYIGIWKKETKPHLLTWTTWFLLTALGFLISSRSNGGFGSLIFAFQSICSLTVAIYAFCKKEKNIVPFDWIIFACALIILIFYYLTKNALVSVILAASIDCLGYVPTFRKSYSQPNTEPVLTYAVTSVSWLMSIFALQTFNFTTLFYPVALVVIDIAFALFLIIRRHSLKK